VSNPDDIATFSSSRTNAGQFSLLIAGVADVEYSTSSGREMLLHPIEIDAKKGRQQRRRATELLLLNTTVNFSIRRTKADAQ
jgi:hypothetical protein